MFIRIKKIRQYKYAYLVTNKWTKHGSRQKVKKYLGKVFPLKRISSSTYKEFFSIDNMEQHLEGFHIENIFRNLIFLELSNHGFSLTEKAHILKKDSILFNFHTNKFIDTDAKKDVVLEMNDNFMCDYTIKKLMNFNYRPDADNYKELATALVEAGLKVDEQMFILMHQKLQKTLSIGFSEFVEKVGY